MSNPNLVEHNKATRWVKGQKVPGAGRKPSHLKKWIKPNNVSKDDIRAILSGIILKAKDIEGLRACLKDPKTPPIVLLPLAALLKDMAKGKTDTLKFLIEYAYGTATQEINQTQANINIKDLPPDERDNILNGLLNKYVREDEDV